ncbi:hypothetical protein OG897_36615 [Streptomyces sp. NBC_00237]|uniref:hypothetical protein n=1 Tax=Streptomyces sp. NBC_00237 TaxID=2975687 RepID=UPI0022559F17|nr:hypothetical protein [Streptomyces sp. NBC_00237]MCX5206912.1 hypothetical protein [Streptomyces sp. NBC_00237]
MTKTPHPTPRTLHAVPEPPTAAEPLTGLTGAPAALFTELAALTEPATTAELALAAGLGRSTAGKALVTLEQHGLATRIPGGHDGPRRTPDRWHTTPTPNTGTTPEAAAADTAVPGTAHPTPAPATDTIHTPNTSEARIPNLPSPDTSNSDEPQPTAPTGTPDSGIQQTAPTPMPAGSDSPRLAPAEPATASALAVGSGPTDARETPNTAESTSPTAAQGSTRPAPADPTPALVAAPEAASTDGKRLAPGGLRQMVIDHLTAHPAEAFTATKISRAIDRSSGAIANALVSLVKQGLAEQVTDRPRTYRTTTAPGTAG